MADDTLTAARQELETRITEIPAGLTDDTEIAQAIDALIAAVRAENTQEIAWRDKRMAWYAHLTEVRGFMR